MQRVLGAIWHSEAMKIMNNNNEYRNQTALANCEFINIVGFGMHHLSVLAKMLSVKTNNGRNAQRKWDIAVSLKYARTTRTKGEIGHT